MHLAKKLSDFLITIFAIGVSAVFAAISFISDVNVYIYAGIVFALWIINMIEYIIRYNRFFNCLEKDNSGKLYELQKVSVKREIMFSDVNDIICSENAKVLRRKLQICILNAVSLMVLFLITMLVVAFV